MTTFIKEMNTVKKSIIQDSNYAKKEIADKIKKFKIMDKFVKRFDKHPRIYVLNVTTSRMPFISVSWTINKTKKINEKSAKMKGFYYSEDNNEITLSANFRYPSYGYM